ncbi:MAG: T9SS type A sorting domain-containing protein [Bacteroidota bacterium]
MIPSNSSRALLAAILLLFSGSQLQGQALDWFTNISFEKDGRSLFLTNAGGLNAPQFSDVDLNNDGVMDLFVFDRIGDVELTFLNQGTANEVSYTFAPEYISQFPEMTNFALLRDYDNDGVMDLFAQAQVPGLAAVEVYKGYYDNGKIAFRKILFPEDRADALYVPSLNNGRTQLYVSTQDIPAIDDIDGDGDLDILSFETVGGIVNYYRNLSVENGYQSDTLIYVLRESCWGKFFESGITNCLILSDEQDECAEGIRGGVASTRHAGSTLLTFDKDNDGDKEILLGDVSFPNLVLGNNDGDANNAFVQSIDCDYPSYDVSADIPEFPGSFLVDVDNDGKRDLLAAPNALNGKDVENVWYYRNVGTEAIPDFSFQKEDFLVGDMLDIGTGAIPRFVDYNADGKMDLVIGNELFFNPTTGNKVVLQLYVNVGTTRNPKYRLEDDDWLNFSQLVGVANVYLAPTFGDLDNDGDMDLLVGESDGRMFFAENVAGPGRTMSFGPVRYPYQNIRVGQLSFPVIDDINEDGKPDLLVGERNGNVNLLLNTGTATDPSFDSDLTAASNNQFFGRIDARDVSIFGFSSPRVVEVDGEKQYFIGSFSGTVKRYINDQNDLTMPFTKVDDDYGRMRLGDEVHLDFADIDGDGFNEMVIGNRRGGISFFNTDIRSTLVSTGEIERDLSVELFPVPTDRGLTIQLPEDVEGIVQARVYNALGQSMRSFSFRGPRHTLDVSNLAAGVYFLELSRGDQRLVKRFVKQLPKQ